jgi:3-oxoacyl-[acyl-carrier protein] reductase
MLMKDRVVLVTGAGRGIGAATAIRLAEHGAAVAVNYLQNETAARKVVDAVAGKGGKALAVQADVREAEQVERMARSAAEKLGPIDTLVINAAMGFPVTPFLQYEWKDFAAKLEGELRAAFFCCKAVVPAMVERKRGCIVGISSGLSRQPGTGFCAHSTAKSALDAFMKSLALELGPHGIRVNTVAPGLTLTDATSWMPEEQKQAAAAHTPMRRLGLPEDVAGAVLMVASDQGGFVTGTYLPVSGGTQML